MLINRRGYPGSDPITDEERNELLCNTDTAIVNANLQKFMDRRTQEIHKFLCLFIKNENIKPCVASKSHGGIILAGWSVGASFALGFIANAKRFSRSIIDGVDIKRYLRHVVLYGL